MQHLLKALKAPVADATGATSIEYGIIAAGIFLAIITPVVAMGDELGAIYQQIGGLFP